MCQALQVLHAIQTEAPSLCTHGKVFLEKLESLSWSQISPHLMETDGSYHVHKSPTMVPKSNHINSHTLHYCVEYPSVI